MPITGNSSYIPTTNLFLAHWSEVNAALPPAEPLVLKTALARAGLVTLRDGLETLLQGVQDKINDLEIARGELDALKVAALGRLNEFNSVLEAFFEGTPLAAARPKAPGIGEGEERFSDPLRDMKSLWAKVNTQTAPPGLTLPLVLDEEFALADFTAQLEALKTAFATVGTAEQNLKLERFNRDAKQAVIYEALKLYRLTVPARVRNNQALLDSLPALTPEPGHTPDAVNASAVFVPPDQSRIVYDASTDADLYQYELRGNAGATFRSEDAVVIANNAPEATREFVTDFGLTQPGAKASFSVYVVTNTGNEKGSTPMTVTRV